MNTLSRRTFLGAASAAAVAAQGRKNVVFLAVDDLNTHLGCYGAKVQSPNIDGLARQGVRFANAYCQYPLCNPSRTSLLTGRRPPSTKVQDNRTWFRDTIPDAVTLPQLFRENGYRTAVTGKIFHGGLDDNKGWEIGAGRFNLPPQKSAAERKGQADRWLAVEGEGEDLLDHRTATRAIELLEKLRGGPFFLAAGFAKPHVPLIAPKKYFDLYDPNRVELPSDFASLPAGPPPSYRPNFDLFIEREATPGLAREALAAYKACVTFTDAQIGRVLAALDRLGLRDNTVISLFGDHGWHLGEKGMWSKMSLFEVSTRAPLVISAPGHRGGVSSRIVEFVDIYPTLADLCGLRPPAALDGRSLKPLLADPAASWDKPAFTYLKRGQVQGISIRTNRYRYTEWNGGIDGAELYDESDDPRESDNLARNPKHAATVKTLSGMLRS